MSIGADSDKRAASVQIARFVIKIARREETPSVSNAVHQGDNILDRVSQLPCVRRHPRQRRPVRLGPHRKTVTQKAMSDSRAPLVIRLRALDYKPADFPGLRHSLPSMTEAILDGVGSHEIK